MDKSAWNSCVDSRFMMKMVSVLALLLLVFPCRLDCRKGNIVYPSEPLYYALPSLRGPNVCAMEQVLGTQKRYYSECFTPKNRQICGRDTFIRYHCCTGFEIEGDTEGCQGVRPMESLMDTIKHLYLREVRRHAHRTEALTDRLQHGGAYTVFAPENAAFSELPPDVNAKFLNNDADLNLLSYHMVNGRYYTDDMSHNMEIPTLFRNNATVRINRYSNGIVTVNCARLILANQPAMNGLVHVIEKVIRPIEEAAAANVMELLLFDTDLGEFVTALVLTDLANQLRASAGTFTIFAPSDQAFRSAPPDLIARVLGDNQLVEELLKYHMIDEQLCSSAILGPTTFTTLGGQKVNVTCDVTDSVTINGVPLTKKDNVAYNGVVHTIDQLLIPDSIKVLSEKITELGLLDFKNYAQDSGLYNSLMTQTNTNYTILVPSQEAFANLTAYQRDILRSSSQALDRLMNYHVIPGHISTRQMVGDNTLITHMSSSTINAYSNMKVYTQSFGVNSANIISGNHAVANGVIHVTDEVLWPPEGVLMDRIQEDPQLRTFLSLLQISDLDEMLLQEGSQYTVFAPTNDAFDAMATRTLEHITINPELLTKFLQNHIIPSPTYLRTLADKWRYRFKTLQGDWIQIKRKSRGEREVINEIIDVIERDVQATNGVLQKIDTVLSCSCLSHDETFT